MEKYEGGFFVRGIAGMMPSSEERWGRKWGETGQIQWGDAS